MWRALVTFIISFSFIKISFSQNYKIEIKPLNYNLTFDSLVSGNDEVLVTVFYKIDGLKKDCNLSRIKDHSPNECSLSYFKEKLSIILNKCSFSKFTRFQIYYWDEGEYYLSDRLNGKNFNNKRNLDINDLTAFVNMNDITASSNSDSYLKYLNKVSKQNLLIESSFPISSIFDFSKSILRKGIPNYECPGDIRVLCKDSNTVYSSNSCPALDIPIEDMFMEHLSLIFRPNHVLNTFIIMDRLNQDSLYRYVDSLDEVVNVQRFNIEQLELKLDQFKNRLEFGFNLSIVNMNNRFLGNDVTKINCNSYQSFGINYSRELSKYFEFSLAAVSSKFYGNIKNDSLSYYTQDYSIPDIILNRSTSISDLSESWNTNNLNIGLGLSFRTVFNLGKKRKENGFVNCGLNIGKYLPFYINTSLQDGDFSYRANIAGVSDQFQNINSLNLLDNVNYDKDFEEKLLFQGVRFGFRSQFSFFLNKNIFIGGMLDLSYQRFQNLNFNSKSIVSNSLGDFNTSLYNIESITLMPISLGVNLGFKF